MPGVTDLESGPERRLPIRSHGDELRARNLASSLADDIGFEPSVRSDIGLVATELAANVIEYTTGGEFAASSITSGDRRGIRLRTTDSGPGIASIDSAFAVGVSSGDSLGYGLAMVNHLVDTIEVVPVDGPSPGTTVLADRWLGRPDTTTGPSPFSVGAATRSMASQAVNGDTFVLERWNDSILVGVIDGLGHGPAANLAASRARDYVESHFDQPLESIFAGTERACTGTRGVVMGLARFDWTVGTVTVGNVGNITIRAAADGQSAFPVRRGVVGGRGPPPTVVTEPWDETATMILHSDGIGGWSWADVLDRTASPGVSIANWLVDERADPTDDATVVVVTGCVDR